MLSNNSHAHERWRQAPVVDLARLVSAEPLLVLAPHADDETIGCGGLIQQARRAGLPVYIDVLTDGSRSHPRSKTHDRSRLARLRQREATQAAALLGVAEAALSFWPEEDSCLLPDDIALVERLRSRIVATGARSVFVSWVDDPHCDHKAAFALAVRAVAKLERPPRLFGYPVWSWTLESMPRHASEGEVVRLDIAADLARKREALACHASQLGQVIHDDPEGFSLTAADLALFMQPYETFIAVASAAS